MLPPNACRLKINTEALWLNAPVLLLNAGGIIFNSDAPWPNVEG